MKNRILSRIFTILALILSHIMCADVAFDYCNMLWEIEYKGASAPAEIGFLTAIPYMAGIIVCIVLAVVFHKREK